MDGAELAGATRPDLPGPGSAHREAGDHDPVGVDSVDAPGTVAGLEHVDEPRPLPAIAVAAEGEQHDRVVGHELRFVVSPLMEEVEVGLLLAATVEPDPEWHRLRQVECIRNPEAVRLHGAIERGTEAVHRKPSGGPPGTLAAVDRIEPGRGLVARPDRVFEVGRSPPFATVEGELHRLDQYLDIGPRCIIGGRGGLEALPQVGDSARNRLPGGVARGLEFLRQVFGRDTGGRQSARDGRRLRGESNRGGCHNREQRCQQ